jgi:hypothetical protein
MADPPNLNRDYWIKQSEMLQSVIARMASNSLEVKKFGLTVWAAIVGFGFTNHTIALFWLALITFLLFGLLDIYYLYLERRFRRNFNRLTRLLNGYGIREDDEWSQAAQGNFLRLDSSTHFLLELSDTLKSWANLPYLVTILVTIALLVVPLPPK